MKNLFSKLLPYFIIIPFVLVISYLMHFNLKNADKLFSVENIANFKHTEFATELFTVSASDSSKIHCNLCAMDYAKEDQTHRYINFLTYVDNDKKVKGVFTCNVLAMTILKIFNTLSSDISRKTFGVIEFKEPASTTSNIAPSESSLNKKE